MSKDTRKQIVLAYLVRFANQWIPGSTFIQPEVGGSEGLRRLRELRKDGYQIEKRKDPYRAMDQYRLVMEVKQDSWLGPDYATSLQGYLA